jgi:uncharacterized protein YndB with AHSA1/START domain
MVEFHSEAECRAPARAVWKLLYDPRRFAEWWPGWERVEAGTDGHLAHYDARWPDFAYPTSVTTDSTGTRIVVSCMLSDIVHTWAISPRTGGCLLSVLVAIPDTEAARADEAIAIASTALATLVARAQHTDDA